MTLKEARETYYSYSGKLSEITRQLSFAGIAVIWIFRVGDKPATGFVWDKTLLLPLVLFVAALGCDLLQYLYASFAWGVFHRCKEKQFREMRAKDGERVEDDFKAHRAINWPTLFFFWSKAFIAAAGHTLLLKHLAGVLWK